MGDDRLVLAHGLGGAQDLPIPPELAIVGATAALAVSFTVLAVAWRRPRYADPAAGRPAPAWLQRLVESTAFTWLARLVGLFFFGWAAFAAIFGQDLLTNPFFGMVYVLLWVGLVPASLLLGPFWKAISPVRTVNLAFAKLAGSDPDTGLRRYPERLGYWPAALGLLAFVWLELVYPYSTELGPVRLWFALYVAAMLVGGAVFGSTFYARADPFEVYSTMVARMSVWGWRDRTGASGTAAADGRDGTARELVVRSPLANLDRTPPRPGLVAVVAVLFGSTAYDSFRDASAWLQLTQSLDRTLAIALNNVVLLAFCVVVGALLAAATAAYPAEGHPRRALPGLFAHSVVPIIVGYVVAHYLSYLVQTGQQTVILMSDPLSNGSDLLGTGDWSVNYWLAYHPTFLAVTKVLAVVVGHVLGVVAAHERSIQVLPRRHQLTGQLPLLVVMVAFTAGGLYLLFAA